MIPLALALLLQAQPAASPSAAASAAPSPAPAAPVVVRPSVEPVTPPPVPDVVLGLVRKTTAFAPESGRAALRARPTAPAFIPGIDDKGYFVEIEWTEKDGTAKHGVAVLAHKVVQEVPWTVKPEGDWGLVQVMEGKTIPGVVDEIKRTRIAANEAMAVNDLRTLITGEMLFMSLAEGAYGEFKCLNRPSDCIVGIPEEQMLDKSYLATDRNGYRRRFHGGEAVTNAKAKNTPSGFVKTFAFTAVPITPGETGIRSFCGDHTGKVCVRTDGSEPPVKGGACALPCTELPVEKSAAK
jgi:hypothetical protein